MIINSLESVRDFPPFFSDLIVQIRESKLLANYANVFRLQLELFDSIVRYKAAIKLSLLIKYDPDRKLPISAHLQELRSPDTSLWIKFALCNLDGLKVDKSSQPLLKSLQTIFMKWSFAGSHKSLRREMEDLSRGLISNYQAPKNSIELITLLQTFITNSIEHEISKSSHLVEKSSNFLEAGLATLVEEISRVLEYRLCSLQSFVSDANSIEYFFRAHYGGSVLPFVINTSEEIKIGSVFLMKETSTKNKNSFEPILCLSPIIVSPAAQKYDEMQTRLMFFQKFHGTIIEYINLPKGNINQDQRFVEDFIFLHDMSEEYGFENANERMYYHKLLHYYKDGVVDEQEEQTIKIMQKVFNLPLDRLRIIEKRIKSELGILEDSHHQKNLESYRQLFLSLSDELEIEAMERFTLQEHARNMDLRSTEVWEIELACWTDKASTYMKSGDKNNLRKALVQISLIDFQNALINQCKEDYDVSIDDHEMIIERNKLFSEYLSYLQIVYANQQVRPDERRFLEIQRKRLRINEREAFELEFLEENLVGVLHHEIDDYYEMQKENFKLGGILLSQGLIDDQQLQLGLEVQSRDPGNKLGAVLYELGFINNTQLKRCLDLQKHLVFRRKSYLLGSIALKFAFVDQRQLKECLKKQEQHFNEYQINRKLGDILLEQGYISNQALSFLLSIQSLSKDS